MSSYDAVETIEEALRTEVVLTGGFLRLRPAPDGEIAVNIVQALEAAGFEIVKKSAGAPNGD